MREWIDTPQISDVQWPTHAVEFACAAFVMLRFFVVRQRVLIAPSGDAEILPAVVIFGVSAAIDHSIDRAGSAEHLAARPEDFAVVQVRLCFGLVRPIAFGFEELAKGRRNMNLLLFIRAASFK